MKSRRINEDVVPVMVPGQVILRKKMKKNAARSLVDSLTEDDSHNTEPLIPVTAKPLAADGDEKEDEELDATDLPAAPRIPAPKSASAPATPPPVPESDEPFLVLIFGPEAKGATVSRLNESQVVVNYKTGRAKVFNVSEGAFTATSRPVKETPTERAPLPPAPGGVDTAQQRRVEEAYASMGMGPQNRQQPVMETQLSPEQVIQGASQPGQGMPAPSGGSNINDLVAKMRTLGVKVPGKE